MALPCDVQPLTELQLALDSKPPSLPLALSSFTGPKSDERVWQERWGSQIYVWRVNKSNRRGNKKEAQDTNNTTKWTHGMAVGPTCRLAGRWPRCIVSRCLVFQWRASPRQNYGLCIYMFRFSFTCLLQKIGSGYGPQIWTAKMKALTFPRGKINKDINSAWQFHNTNIWGVRYHI